MHARKALEHEIQEKKFQMFLDKKKEVEVYKQQKKDQLELAKQLK